MSRRTVCGVLAACLVFSQLTGCGEKAAQSSAPEPSFGVQVSAARTRCGFRHGIPGARLLRHLFARP